MKKLTTVGIAAIILSACGGDGDDNPCGPFNNVPFDIVGLEVQALSYTELPESIATPITTSPIAQSDLIIGSQLVLRLATNTQSTQAQLQNSQLSSDSWPGLSIFSKAYACSPPLPFTNEVISDITITSDRDFSAELPAGSNLNELFEVAYMEYGTYYNVDSNGERSYMTLNEFIASTPNGAMSIQLLLKTAPQSEKNHQFTVDYQHSDGEQYTVSTGTVNFE